MEYKDDKQREIEEILQLIEPKKKFYLLQTNVNEREDLSQELDILLYQKLKVQLEKQPATFYQYLIENETKTKE